MKNKDLKIAKKELKERSLSLVVVKNGETLFESFSQGISGFLQAIETHRRKLEGASVADKIVGEAIALLCIYANVRAVYAETLSNGAKSLFEKHSLYCEWDNLVENILDASKTKTCPFEKASQQISNPKEAYAKLKRLYETLKTKKA